METRTNRLLRERFNRLWGWWQKLRILLRQQPEPPLSPESPKRFWLERLKRQLRSNPPR